VNFLSNMLLLNLFERVPSNRLDTEELAADFPDIRAALTSGRDMMRDMLYRAFLAAAAIAAAAVSPVSPAHADPQCPPTGCPHGPANTAPGPGNAAPGPATPPAPPPVNVNSPSYKDGYKTEHDYFANPQNHAYLASEMKSGYTVASACQVEMGGGMPPPNANDWLAGCAAALHDLGFKS
jgi:hypothetical protein